MDLQELGMSSHGSDAALLEPEGVMGVGSHRVSRYRGRTGEQSIGFEENVGELGQVGVRIGCRWGGEVGSE